MLLDSGLRLGSSEAYGKEVQIGVGVDEIKALVAGLIHRKQMIQLQ